MTPTVGTCTLIVQMANLISFKKNPEPFCARFESTTRKFFFFFFKTNIYLHKRSKKNLLKKL